MLYTFALNLFAQMAPAPNVGGAFQTFLDILGATEGVITIAAIVVAGTWTYFLFWKERQTLPRAVLDLTVEQHRIQRNKLLVRVTAVLSNSGRVPMCIERGYARMHAIRPSDKTFGSILDEWSQTTENIKHHLPAPLISKLKYTPTKNCLVESMETEHVIFDFIVPDGKFQLVEIYVYFSNLARKDREIGWGKWALLPLLDDLKKDERNATCQRKEKTEPETAMTAGT